MLVELNWIGVGLVGFFLGLSIWLIAWAIGYKAGKRR